MSGTIAQAVGTFSTASRMASALFGAAPLVLGGVAFANFEVPETISGIGGNHALNVHRLSGGVRQVDANGADDAPLSWSGNFLGFDAQARAVAIDELRIAGQPIPLVFGDWYFSVVIESFTCELMRNSHLPYRISCLVIQNMTAPPQVSLISAALQLTGDVAGAAVAVSQMFATPPGSGVSYPSPATALAQAQADANAAALEGLRLNSASQVRAAASSAIARDSLNSAMAAAGAVLQAKAALAPTGGLVASVDDFQAAYDQAANSAFLAAGSGLIGRAARNAILGSV